MLQMISSYKQQQLTLVANEARNMTGGHQSPPPKSFFFSRRRRWLQQLKLQRCEKAKKVERGKEDTLMVHF